MSCVRFHLRVALGLLIALTPTLALAYTLGPGDSVTIEVRTEQTQLSLDSVVSVDGRIYVPPTGAFAAEGKTPVELEAEIARELERYYVGQVQVVVLVTERKEIVVSVLGQVAEPGEQRLPDERPLLSQAVTQAGGLLPQASSRRVSLVRGGQEIGPIDLYAILSLGRSDQDVVLHPQDVVYVATRERWVTVIGPAQAPAVYELLHGDRLSHVLVMAGGLTAAADPERAVIERPTPDGEPQTIEVNPRAALADPGGDADPPLIFGDTVRLVSRLTDVYLAGEVAQPGAKPFEENRTVIDYIGLAGGATNRAVLDRVVIVRRGNAEPRTIPVDLAKFMTGRAEGAPPLVAQGDVIFVPGRRIATVQDWGSLGQVLTGIVAAIRIF